MRAISSSLRLTLIHRTRLPKVSTRESIVAVRACLPGRTPPFLSLRCVFGRVPSLGDQVICSGCSRTRSIRLARLRLFEWYHLQLLYPRSLSGEIGVVHGKRTRPLTAWTHCPHRTFARSAEMTLRDMTD